MKGYMLKIPEKKYPEKKNKKRTDLRNPNLFPWGQVMFPISFFYFFEKW